MPAKHKSHKGFKHMTEQEYANIKLLKQAGLSQKQAANVTKRSQATICNIYKTEDYAAYKEAQKPKEAPEPRLDTAMLTTITPDADIKDVTDALVNIYDKLEAMHESIKWIENHTEVKPRKSSLWRS